MDTERLKQIGESFIVYSLLNAGILVAKPFFDQLGTDLIGFTSIDDKARFCRIQCKYRELKKSTSVRIDSNYVVGAFILFLYVKYTGKRHFYCLLPEDILRIFKYDGTINYFKLSITRNIMLSLDEDKSIKFTHEKVASIFELMKSSSPVSEIRRLFSGLEKNIRKLNETHRKHSALKQLMHEIEVANIKKKVVEEKLKILEEYLDFMEKHYEGKKG